MTTLARNPVVESEYQRRHSRRRDDLTFTLLSRLRIRPEDRTLSALLGYFEARSNHAALLFWIDRQLAGLPASEHVEPLDVLERRLRALLVDSGHGDELRPFGYGQNSGRFIEQRKVHGVAHAVTARELDLPGLRVWF